MSVGSRAGLGVLLLAALLIVLIVDTFPLKWRSGLLIALGLLSAVGWLWL